MEIEINNSVAIHHFLALANDQGWNWVAFDRPIIGQVDHFYGFVSAGEATEFCAANNIRFDLAEENFVDGDFQCLPIATLAAGLVPTPTVTEPLITGEQLVTQLAAQEVALLRSLDMESTMPLIRSGLVFPVQFDAQIDPRELVDRFIVVAHHHSGHQVYELGHSVKVMNEFDTLDKAEQYFSGLIRQYHDNNDKNDYQLIGLYRGQDQHLDMEGTPENYSGITLRTAYFQHDPDLKVKVWQVENNFDLDRPTNIRHFLYAQYDAKNARFKLLDDRLKETCPEDIKISTYPSYFINEKLTIKNLSIMNEQSYDYVKNQLLYMGFGEEIAQPLKEKMEQGLKEFTLNHTRSFGKDQTENVLHFSKGDDQQKDLTFFNRFDVNLKQEGKEDLKQIFFVGQQYNYTLQERYNMMDGRFAYREQPKVEPKEVNGEIKMVPTGETYTGWKGLDFKQSDEYGNFLPKTLFWNHEKELNRYPIKELAEPYDKSRLLVALQRGDKAKVTIQKGDEEIKGLVVANPRMVRLDFYDTNGQAMIVRPVEKQKLAQAESQGEHQSEAQGKNEAAAQSQAPSQNPEKAESKDQTQQQGQQTGKNQEQKPQVAEGQKNDTAQRKKQGARI